MAYTALQLINRAYFLSQVVSRELQTVGGDQENDGLFLLNALLDFKSTDVRLIPYYRRSTFNFVLGQEEYFIQDLLLIDAMTFNIGVVRYPLQNMSRYQYFGTARVDGIQSLPYQYRAERELGGTRIFFYFSPSGTYTVNLSGKFALTEVSLTTDLSLIYDQYYIEYMRYDLANYICSEYGATLPDASMMRYKEMQKKLMDVEPKDLSIKKVSYCGNGYPLDWQTINLTTGWVPF